MRPTDDCTDLTPEERRAELASIFAASIFAASIFAAGILRLRMRAATPADNSGPEKPSESDPERLELPAKTVLSAHGG